MDSLRAAHPLADSSPIVLSALTVRVARQLNLIELRAGPPFREDSAFALLPGPGLSSEHSGWRANWLRPDGWLLIDAAESSAARRRFVEAANRKQCRMIDLSHSLVCISISGAASRELLARGTPLDLRPAAFGPGQCTRTRCAGFTVMLDHRADSIDVYVDTSLAPVFWNWIEDAKENLCPSSN
jgi:heterotetrameric sarcosine oxidase gamma subunit